MKKYAIAAALAALVLTAPAAAQNGSGIFAEKGSRIVAKLAHLSFPRTIGALAVTGTTEFSRKGESLDNGIQYQAQNGIWATVYVYLPGYPDAGLAAYETDRILPLIYGKDTTRKSQGVVPFAGQLSGAIRYIYSGAVLNDRKLATASAFARVGGWVVKIRVTGPAELQTEVETSLDAMIAAAQLDGQARVFPVGVPDFAEPCPAAASGQVSVIKDENGMATAFLTAIGGSIANDPGKKGETPLAAAFPANGLTRMCVRGSVALGDRNLIVLQPAGTAKPDTIIVMLSDNGDLATISKDMMGDHYSLSKTDIGRISVLGTLDRMPDNDELLRLFTGKVPDALKMRAVTTFKADGNSAISITTPPDKK
jgi:hypothetical protein